MKLLKVRNGSQIDIHMRVNENQEPRELTVASNIQTELLADYIVRACNCHEELVEACQVAVNTINYCAGFLLVKNGKDNIQQEGLNQSIIKLEQALTKATE